MQLYVSCPPALQRTSMLFPSQLVHLTFVFFSNSYRA